MHLLAQRFGVHHRSRPLRRSAFQALCGVVLWSCATVAASVTPPSAALVVQTERPVQGDQADESGNEHTRLCGQLVAEVEAVFRSRTKIDDAVVVFRTKSDRTFKAEVPPFRTLDMTRVEQLDGYLKTHTPRAVLIAGSPLDDRMLARIVAAYERVTPFLYVTEKRKLTVSHYASALLFGFSGVVDSEADPAELVQQWQKIFASRREEDLLLARVFAEAGLAGVSAEMLEVYRRVARAAQHRRPVLLTGPTGTGKERIAHAIHWLSSSVSGPPKVLNCANLPPNLVESELFGHEKGAFTGAIASKRGIFAAAQGTTIILDEVQALPLEVQPKLLRVLQEGKARAVGSNEDYDVNARVIAISNRSIPHMVAQGEFGADLYHRLNQYPIEVPRLATRPQDVQLQAYHLLRAAQITGPMLPPFAAATPLLVEARRQISDFAAMHLFRGSLVQKIDPMVLEVFAQLRWDGNTRELENAVREAVDEKVDGTDTLYIEDLPKWVLRELVGVEPMARNRLLIPVLDNAGYDEATNDFHRQYIRARIRRHNGNLRRASRELGMTHQELKTRMKALQLRPDGEPMQGP